MKNISLYLSAFFFAAFSGSLLTACSDSDENAANEALSIKVFSPTKVIAGQEVIINGTGLDEVKEVVFPGGVTASDITVVTPNDIRVVTPAGVAAQGGELTVQSDNESVTARVPMTVGNPQLATAILSVSDNMITITGTDMEFFKQAIFPGLDGKDIVIDAIDFGRKSTGLITVRMPDNCNTALADQIRLVSVAGQSYPIPEMAVPEPPKEPVLWEGETPVWNWFYFTNELLKPAYDEFGEPAVGKKIRFFLSEPVGEDGGSVDIYAGWWAPIELGRQLSAGATYFDVELTDDIVNPYLWGAPDLFIMQSGSVIVKLAYVD